MPSYGLRPAVTLLIAALSGVCGSMFAAQERSSPASSQQTSRASEGADVAALRRAAEQGDAIAQLKLGIRYDGGLGVPQNYVLAASWYRKAADQGLAAAQYNLGVSYQQGQGVSRDFAQAAAWYRKA